jgi:hypothetical protein
LLVACITSFASPPARSEEARIVTSMGSEQRQLKFIDGATHSPSAPLTVQLHRESRGWMLSMTALVAV